VLRVNIKGKIAMRKSLKKVAPAGMQYQTLHTWNDSVCLDWSYKRCIKMYSVCERRTVQCFPDGL